MAQSQIEAVVFKDHTGEKSTDASLHIKVFDNKDSLWRALRRLGLFWLLALASLPLIGAHWILVPGFLILGPIAAVMVYRTRQVLDKTSGVCPECREPIEIKMEPKEQLPKWTYCPQCNKSLQICR